MPSDTNMGFLNPQVKSKWQVIVVVGDNNKLLIWLRLWLWLCLLGGRNRHNVDGFGVRSEDLCI